MGGFVDSYCRFGECNKRAGLPQYLLEALPSGDLIPILSFKRNSEDRSWVQWTSKDFGAFSEGCGIEKLQALQRFNFLGQFMARAYVISDLSYAPASFHPVIYDSLMAGHAVPPAPDANAYQDRICHRICSVCSLYILVISCPS